jgi:hypothetical protein
LCVCVYCGVGGKREACTRTHTVDVASQLRMRMVPNMLPCSRAEGGSRSRTHGLQAARCSTQGSWNCKDQGQGSHVVQGPWRLVGVMVQLHLVASALRGAARHGGIRSSGSAVLGLGGGKAAPWHRPASSSELDLIQGVTPCMDKCCGTTTHRRLHALVPRGWGAGCPVARRTIGKYVRGTSPLMTGPVEATNFLCEGMA